MNNLTPNKNVKNMKRSKEIRKQLEDPYIGGCYFFVINQNNQDLNV